MLRQIGRKKSIKAWENRYYEMNKDIIEAKRQAEEDARKEIERLEKEATQPRKRASGDEDNRYVGITSSNLPALCQFIPFQG